MCPLKQRVYTYRYRFNTPPPVEISQPDNNILICLTKSNSPLAGIDILLRVRDTSVQSIII